jgi:DNA-binding NarL/FixJ family response regulator|nr:response regulator transcription factor [uncultured Macellibacteroides sp.]
MNVNLRIAIADPSVIIRSGVEAILKRISSLRIYVDEISGADALYEYMKKHQPDVLIINPAFLGYYSLAMLKEECGCSRLKCVALLYAVAEHSLLKQYDDFITIYDSPEEIKNKIEKISNQYEVEKTEGEDELQTLSVREREIVVCVVKGLTNREIAEQLYLSAHTVITHRRNIARKLQIHSASGLTVYAIVNKLIELDDIKK